MNAQPESNVRLRGRWLILARVTWVTLTVIAIGIFIVGSAALYNGIRHTCAARPVASPPDCFLVEQTLEQINLWLDLYAAYFTMLSAIVILPCFAIGALIFRRKSDEPSGLFFSAALVTAGAVVINEALPLWLLHAYPALSLPVNFVYFLGVSSAGLAWYLFPDGRFVPSWTRWLAGLWVLQSFLRFFVPDSPLNYFRWPAPLPVGVIFGIIGSGVYALIYRYWRASDAVQRQQIKWVVASWVVVGLVYAAGIFIFSFIRLNLSEVLIGMIYSALYHLSALLVLACLGISILRYRLWDIDLIIRRTLIYSVLTGMLALVYFSSVVVLQAAFSAVGQRSELVIILSTLAIAALFAPLRRRVQNAIDRRFYRRKYDAAQTLAEFAASVRDETDLDRLAARLVEVVNETMQPESISLWLKPVGARQRIQDEAN